MRLTLICHHCGAAYSRPSAAVARGSRFCSGPCRVAVVTAAFRKPLSERFWKKVDRRGASECWPWIGGCFADRYGAISVDGKPRRAPRVAYELAIGPIPEGMGIRHACDNPKCVNPAHLTPGTHADNMADKVRRGRAHRMCKLTDDQVSLIRESERKAVDLALEFGVSAGLINLIRGKTAHRVKRPVVMSTRKERAILKKCAPPSASRTEPSTEPQAIRP